MDLNIAHSTPFRNKECGLFEMQALKDDK